MPGKLHGGRKKVQEPHHRDETDVLIEDAVSFVAERYGYRLHDCYSKTFRQGGITYRQLGRLYELAMKRDVEAFKLNARLQGVTIDDDPSNVHYPYTYGILPSEDEVQYMSIEERRKLTQELMKTFSSSAGGIGGITFESRIRS